MKAPTCSLEPSAADASPSAAAGHVPSVAEVLGEIGWLLALHLAAALAATLALNAAGLP